MVPWCRRNIHRWQHIGGSALKAWICLNCGFVYDEARGDPDAGIAPGTAWDDVPDDWVCPDCGAPKSSFEMVEL